MGDTQSVRRGQVDTLLGAIVTRGRRFEGMTSEDRQFVITNIDTALDLFMRVVHDRDVHLVSPKQVSALKYLIARAKGGTDFLKQLMFILLDRSELLTKNVYITLEPSEDLSGEVIHEHAVSAAVLHSSNCTTHLDQVMRTVGTEFRFSVHYGHYDPDGSFNTVGMFAGWPGHESDPKGMPTCYTFWLARGAYGHAKGELHPVEVSKADVEAIDLSKDGLYDNWN